LEIILSFLNKKSKKMSYLQSVKSSWDEIKESLKSKYSTLKEEDLHYAEGKEDELYKKLEKKLGIERSEIDKFLKEHHQAIQKMGKK
jgi:uncharacterized protein YjbJ (UPF0337 family)